MRATVERKALLGELKLAKRLIGAGATLPVLANVLLQVHEGGGLTVTATDLDCTYVGQVPEARVQVEVADKAAARPEAGAVTVPAVRLLNLVKDADSETVRLEADGEEVTVTAGALAVKLIGIPFEEYPALPKAPKDAATFTPQALVDLAARTLYCTSRDETRPSLNGLHMAFGEAQVEACATDGHRMAVAHVAVKSNGLAGAEAIVMPKALDLAVRLCQAEIKRARKAKEDPAPVTFGCSGKGAQGYGGPVVSFCIAGAVVLCRALEGPYPKYRQVIPKDNDGRATFDRATLAAAVKRAANLADRETNQVRLEIGRKNARLVVSTPDVGETCETVPCKAPGDKFSPRFSVGYNAVYLGQALAHVPGGESVTFALGPSVQAAVLTADGGPDGDLALLMPLRLNS